MESMTNDSIDVSSLGQRMLRPSEPTQQGSLRSAKTAPQRVVLQPNHADQHTPANQHQLMVEDDSGLPSTVPESLDAHAQVSPAEPRPQAAKPDDKDASKRMSSQGADGDDATQEVSQDFYVQQINLNKSRNVVARDETQHTLHPGEEGHIEFASSFLVHDPLDSLEEESEPVDFLPTQDQTQPRILRYPDSQRFKTPATAGKKRFYNGNTKESPSLPRVPVLRSGGDTPGMALGLSQAFADTQAQTSPFLNGVQDPKSDRPSPNIDLNHRPSTAPVSSPLRMMSEIRPASAEPASHYVSVDESQRMRLEEKNRMLLDDDSEDDKSVVSDFDEIPTQQRQRNRERERSQALRDGNRGRDTPPGSPSQQRRPRNSVRYTTPSTEGQRKTDALHRKGRQRQTKPTTPEPPPIEDESPAASEAETEQEDEDQVQRSSQRLNIDPEDKENLEGAIQIPQTTARATRMMPEIVHDVEASPSLRPHQHPPSSAGPLVPNTQISQSVSQRAQPKSSTTSGLDFVPQSQDVEGQRDEPPVNNQQTKDPFDEAKPASLEHTSDAGDEVERNGDVRSEVELDDEPTDGRDGSPLPDDDVEMHDGSQLGEHKRSDGADKGPQKSSSDMHPHESVQHTVDETTLTYSQTRSNAHSGPDGHDTSLEDQSNFETAPSRMPPPNINAPSSSSPPIRTPRPKRKRMSQISVDASPSGKGWSQDFNPASALKADNDLAAYEDQSPIRPGKRRKTQQSIEVPETASTNAKTNIPSTKSDLGTDGVDELLDPQPAVRPKRSTRSKKDSTDRHSVWDVDVTPSPQQKTPAVKISGRPLRSATGKLPERTTTPTESKEEESGQAQDDSSEASSEEHQPTQTETPKKTPSKKKRQVRQPSEDSSTPATGTPPEKFRTAPVGEILAPNVVFACFNGKTRAYYPAWCVGKGSTEQHYTVQWEGYEPDEVDVYGVRSLDLRVGDQVKVDMIGVPKVSHVIRGFKDKVDVKELSQTMTDQRGFKSLLVAPKQRKSLPADVSTENDREVPISAIYLDNNMWTQMKDRNYEYHSPPESVDVSGYATPVEQASTPTSPNSRYRRHTGLAPTSTVPHHPSGVFKGMVFAVSYEDGDRRRQLDSLIWDNGGHIVGDDGFYDLFDPDSMTLKPKYATSGFTALLADKHSRKPKYLQALALGLPCLSGKWIEACISHQTPVDWRRYLLPAGECDELDGATKSRIMPYIDAGEVKLAQQLDARDRILDSQNVIVIVGRGGKSEAKMKNYIFFIRAMGAEVLERASDVRAAKELLDADDGGGHYTLIYVEKEAESVAAALKAGVVARKGRKKNAAAVKAEWRVVETESIVQSLIFGASVD